MEDSARALLRDSIMVSHFPGFLEGQSVKGPEASPPLLFIAEAVVKATKPLAWPVAGLGLHSGSLTIALRLLFFCFCVWSVV